MKRLLTVCLVTVTLSTSFAYMNDDGQSMTTNWLNTTLRVHRAGNIAFSVTNYGVIGSYGGNEYEPGTQRNAPSERFPAESASDYLFFGSLWIGAEVEDSLNPGEFDTLVSVGGDCWWQDIHEFMPPDQSSESIWLARNMADEEIYAVYYDTLTDPIYVNPDPLDDRPHIPLGLKVTQHSLAWNTPGYDEFVIINYYIENIYDRELHNVWLGLFYDGDVGRVYETPWPEFNDDLCGYLNHNGFGIGWAIDNDGEPDYGQFDDFSVDGVMGIMLAGSSLPLSRTNFNWWISNIQSEYDWGPQWQTNFDIWGIFPGGGRGTPGGDRAKYQIMTNGEIDYDQAFSGLDWTDEGWTENNSQDQQDIADGYDTRFLLSFGPLDLAAGVTESLTVALIAGRALHTEPDNYEDNLYDNTEDSLSIVEYYSNLDFTDLFANADTILNYYSLGFEYIPPGPPRNFGFESWSDNRIVMNWNKYDHLLFSEYRIYRGIEPGVYDPAPITPLNFTDTVFIDEDIQDNTTYYYVISTVNILGAEGRVSPEISINSGQPHTPTGLIAEACNSQVELAWPANQDEDLLAYAIYRKTSTDDEFESIDTIGSASYTDVGLINGIKYIYKIQALDIYGNVSYFSDSVWAIPMAFDSGIMLIDANVDWPQNPDSDSMAVFYDNILDGYEHIIVYECPEDLTQLAPYSTIIWCMEIIPGRIRFDQPEYAWLFADYLESGGKLIIAGTRIVRYSGYQGPWIFNQYDFQYNFLNLEGVEYPFIENTEFTGGKSAAGDFPDFNVDTTRSNRIVSPFENDTGRLLGMGVLIPLDSTEIFYNYVSVNPDTSALHGRPIAIIHQTEVYKTAVLEFPLYYIEEPTSYDILHRILNMFEETVAIEERFFSLPDKIELMQNYPNPFNFKTEIRYTLPHDTQVSIEIYDILGRNIIKLIDAFQLAGEHSVIWDGRNSQDEPATSGIYFYRLTTPEDATAKRMVFIK